MHFTTFQRIHHAAIILLHYYFKLKVYFGFRSRLIQHLIKTLIEKYHIHRNAILLSAYFPSATILVELTFYCPCFKRSRAKDDTIKSLDLMVGDPRGEEDKIIIFHYLESHLNFFYIIFNLKMLLFFHLK